MMNQWTSLSYLQLLASASYLTLLADLYLPVKITHLAAWKVLVLTRLDSILTGELSAPAAKKKTVEANDLRRW